MCAKACIKEEKECGIMQEDGIPSFILAIASAAVVIGIVVGMTAVTWAFILMLF